MGAAGAGQERLRRGFEGTEKRFEGAGEELRPLRRNQFRPFRGEKKGCQAAAIKSGDNWAVIFGFIDARDIFLFQQSTTEDRTHRITVVIYINHINTSTSAHQEAV
jgi:hypothetical protein